jgi:S-phase kinase-associated protein 1
VFVGAAVPLISCACCFLFFLFLFFSTQQISKEGDSFPVPLSVANMSELVKSMMDEDAEDDDDANSPTEIPLPNVKAQVLRKVIEFCEHHLTEPMTEIEKPLKSQNMGDVVQSWYADFVNLEQVLLFELILAANYMDIKPLLDLTCATVASMIKGKTVSAFLMSCDVMSMAESSFIFLGGIKWLTFFTLFYCSLTKFALPSTLPTISHPRKRRRYERRTSGARKLRKTVFWDEAGRSLESSNGRQIKWGARSSLFTDYLLFCGERIHDCL